MLARNHLLAILKVDCEAVTRPHKQSWKTLIKAFSAPDLRRKAAFSVANPCASCEAAKEVLILSALP